MFHLIIWFTLRLICLKFLLGFLAEFAGNSFSCLLCLAKALSLLRCMMFVFLFCLPLYQLTTNLEFFLLALAISIGYNLFKNEAFLNALFDRPCELFAQSRRIQFSKNKGIYIRLFLINKKNSKVLLFGESHLSELCFHH